MKKVLLLSLLVIIGCSSANQIYEDTLYVTKKYAGDFIVQVPEKKRIKIVTDCEVFYIDGHPVLDIPVGARCYVKYSPEHRGAAYRTKYWVLYMTWDGAEDMYMVSQNIYTGEIY